MKTKINEALALGYDICTDFVINPYKEESEIEEGTGVKVFNCCGVFGIDSGVMNLMRRGKDVNGFQRYLPTPVNEEGKKSWCDDDDQLEATDYVLEPLSFPPSTMQRRWLQNNGRDPDELVELFYEDTDILYPSSKYLSWVLSATTNDVEFLRSIVEPLITSREIKMNGDLHIVPVYAPNKSGCNIFFDRKTYDAARVMTVFSKVWRDNVPVVNKDGETVLKSVCVRFYSVPISSEKSMLNELKRILYPSPPVPIARQEIQEEEVVVKTTWRKVAEKPEVVEEKLPSGYRGRFAALNLN